MFSISGARFRDAKHVELDVVVGGRPVVWFEETRPEKRVVLSVSADYHLVIIHPRTSVARRRRLRTPHNGATLRIILSLFLSAVFFRCRRVNSSWRRRRRRRFFCRFCQSSHDAVRSVHWELAGGGLGESVRPRATARWWTSGRASAFCCSPGL